MILSTRSVDAQVRRLDLPLVWDNHVCLPFDPAKAMTHLPELQRAWEAGVHVVSVNVGYGPHGLEQHLSFVRMLRDRIAESGRFELVATVADIHRARERGRLSVCFDVEGAAADLDVLSQLYALGVRWMLCAYNNNNALGGGCHDEDGGLTQRGREWLLEMNRVGMVPCASHTGYRTAMQMIDQSAGPVIFSHSNPRALRDHPRNVPDDLIRACAARGGVIGINGVGIFLGDDDASPARMAEHIDYVASLVGVEHVGIGTDYVFGLEALADELAAAKASFPKGFGYDAPIEFLPPEELPSVAAHLTQLGYGAPDLAAIFGGNFERIAREVWL